MVKRRFRRLGHKGVPEPNGLRSIQDTDIGGFPEMRYSIKKFTVAAMIAGALAVPAVPAMAAPPIVTGGLVNVTIVDVLSGNQVTAQVPLTVAANICNVTVGVLAEDLGRDGTADCSNATQTITVSRQRR
jgi:hypothetical protein